MDLRTKGLTADTKAAGLNCRLMQTRTFCAVLWLWAYASGFFPSRINWSQRERSFLSRPLLNSQHILWRCYSLPLFFFFFSSKAHKWKRILKKGKTGGAGPGGDLEGKDRCMMEEREHSVAALLWLWSAFAVRLLSSNSIVLLPLFGHFTLATGDYLFLWVDLPLSVGILREQGTRMTEWAHTWAHALTPRNTFLDKQRTVKSERDFFFLRSLWCGTNARSSPPARVLGRNERARFAPVVSGSIRRARQRILSKGISEREQRVNTLKWRS